MPSYLGAIGTATPSHRLAQPTIAGFMAAALELDEGGTRKLRALYRVSGIEHRHSVLADYGQENGNYTFFPNTPGLPARGPTPGPGGGARLVAPGTRCRDGKYYASHHGELHRHVCAGA
jgi:hypothetical protein